MDLIWFSSFSVDLSGEYRRNNTPCRLIRNLVKLYCTSSTKCPLVFSQANSGSALEPFGIFF